jgi:hypothetical protein
MCPTALPAMDPISKGSASTGSIATSALTARTELATSFPVTTSYPRRSVRNNNPSVPSRFSSLTQSEVVIAPLSRQ